MYIRWKIAQWFEAWWWRRYLNGKPVEGYLDWKIKYWKRFIKENKIEVGNGDKILDAGCGPAGIFMAFPKNEIWALDPLLKKYRTQLPHFQESNFENVNFECLPLEKFSMPDNFETIFCLNALNHVSDMEICLNNLSASLRKEGRIYLSIDAHNYSFLKKLFQFIPGDILHPHQLDLEGYISLVEKAGLNIERTVFLKHETIFDYHLIVAVKQ